MVKSRRFFLPPCAANEGIGEDNRLPGVFAGGLPVRRVHLIHFSFSVGSLSSSLSLLGFVR